MNRWFIAFPVSAGDWFRRLAPPTGLRLEVAADLHLTVAFLGAVDEERARAAFELTRAWPHSAGPLCGSVRRLAALGNPRRPSVVAAIVDDLDLPLAEWRGPLYAAASVARDERPALPHVTVARFARKADSAQRAAAIAWAEAIELRSARIEIGDVALYRSAGPSAATRYIHEI